MTINNIPEKAFVKIPLILAFLMGSVGILAPKGLAPIVALGGVAGLLWWLRQRPRPALPRTLIGILAVLSGWSVLSAFWALDGGRAITLSLKVAGLCGAGVFLFPLFHALKGPDMDRLPKALAAGSAVGALGVLGGYFYALKTGESLWGTFFFDPLTTLNNSAVMISLLVWPLAAMAWQKGFRIAGGAGLVCVVGFLSLLSSGAALLSIFTGGLAFAVVALLGRRGGMLLATVLSVLLLAAPAIIDMAPGPEKAVSLHPELAPSAQHRIYMWKFVNEHIAEKPVLGWGMDSSRALKQDTRRLRPNMEIMPLHPHNGPLQVRLELGLPGAVIAAILLFYSLQRSVASAPSRAEAGFRAGAVVAYVTIGALSFGVWQNWWIAAAWMLAVLVWLFSAPLSSDRTKPSG